MIKLANSQTLRRNTRWCVFLVVFLGIFLQTDAHLIPDHKNYLEKVYHTFFELFRINLYLSEEEETEVECSLGPHASKSKERMHKACFLKAIQVEQKDKIYEIDMFETILTQKSLPDDSAHQASLIALLSEIKILRCRAITLFTEKYKKGCILSLLQKVSCQTLYLKLNMEYPEQEAETFQDHELQNVLNTQPINSSSQDSSNPVWASALPKQRKVSLQIYNASCLAEFIQTLSSDLFIMLVIRNCTISSLNLFKGISFDSLYFLEIQNISKCSPSSCLISSSFLEIFPAQCRFLSLVGDAVMDLLSPKELFLFLKLHTPQILILNWDLFIDAARLCRNDPDWKVARIEQLTLLSIHHQEFPFKKTCEDSPICFNVSNVTLEFSPQTPCNRESYLEETYKATLDHFGIFSNNCLVKYHKNRHDLPDTIAVLQNLGIIRISDTQVPLCTEKKKVSPYFHIEFARFILSKIEKKLEQHILSKKYTYCQRIFYDRLEFTMPAKYCITSTKKEESLLKTSLTRILSHHGDINANVLVFEGIFYTEPPSTYSESSNSNGYRNILNVSQVVLKKVGEDVLRTLLTNYTYTRKTVLTIHSLFFNNPKLFDLLLEKHNRNITTLIVELCENKKIEIDSHEFSGHANSQWAVLEPYIAFSPLSLEKYLKFSPEEKNRFIENRENIEIIIDSTFIRDLQEYPLLSLDASPLCSHESLHTKPLCVSAIIRDASEISLTEIDIYNILYSIKEAISSVQKIVLSFLHMKKGVYDRCCAKLPQIQKHLSLTEIYLHEVALDNSFECSLQNISFSADTQVIYSISLPSTKKSESESALDLYSKCENKTVLMQGKHIVALLKEGLSTVQQIEDIASLISFQKQNRGVEKLIKLLQSQEENEENRCSVCLKDISPHKNPEKYFCILSCGHYGHYKCISMWCTAYTNAQNEANSILSEPKKQHILSCPFKCKESEIPARVLLLRLNDPKESENNSISFPIPVWTFIDHHNVWSCDVTLEELAKKILKCSH
ncbi:hypothetical protein NEFER03_0973 [Nematocida sp. LUAm3]|nr:hypothetical protein NEFER03_0973 [Nematocida sp. LUAm3]KAI5175423.1 hypothetical protein NEFER02_1352 [Nematocida sp. LUAm2]KAI5177620.1 hypothetical protein NEFER01_0844 [Nematocida sp. LUAm1]